MPQQQEKLFDIPASEAVPEEVHEPAPEELPDKEQDRIIKLTLEIPFFGKRAQAEKFAGESLMRILRTGVSTLVRISGMEIS